MAGKGAFKIRVVKKWPAEELVALYKAGGWWKDCYDPSGLPSLIRGSFAFAVAVESKTGRAVGMARAISDRASDAYIQDFIVLPQYRNKGIGRMLVETIVARLKKKGIHWIGLIAEEGSDGFYTKLGFGPFKGKPMLYRMD